MAGTKSPSHRAYVSGLVVALGPMEFAGDLIPPRVVNAGKEEKFTSICPVHEEAVPVKQQYICPEDAAHGPFSIGECDKAQERDGHYVRVSAQEAVDARKSVLPEKSLDLNVHRASDVEASVLEAGTSYVFRPAGPSKFYGLLLDILAARPDLVFMGECNLRGTDKLVKLERGLNNQLILTELIWPEDLKDFETPVYEYKPSLLDTATVLAEKTVTDFDPEEYHREARDRIAELLEAKKDGKAAPAPKTKAKVKDDDDNLEALLQAAIAEATG